LNLLQLLSVYKGSKGVAVGVALKISPIHASANNPTPKYYKQTV